MAGDFALHQAVIRVATTLEQIRLICDRTHEENLLAERQGREAEPHYAYALGTIMATALAELERLQAIGIQRSDSPDEANARAQASLAAFKRALQKNL